MLSKDSFNIPIKSPDFVNVKTSDTTSFDLTLDFQNDVTT